MSTLRGLCIGAGYFSRYHLDAWRRIPEVEIAAVCDIDPGKAAQAAREFSLAGTWSDAAAALDAVQPDFVDIVTPPDTHLALVEQAARRGVAVICQKPLAPDDETACRLADVVDRSGIPFMVHENFRFQPWHREIKRLLEAGVIGRLHSLSFRSRPGDGWRPDAYLDRQPYFREMPRLLVHETGVHFIDTFRFLAGEIEEAYAILRRLNRHVRGEDAGLLTLRFASGAVGVWDANRYNESTDPDPRYTFGEFLVEGDAGSIRLDPDGRLTVQPLGEPEREHPYAHERRGFGGDCVYFTQRHFVERLRSGQPFETHVADYLRTLAVQEAVYRSAEQNRPVRVREAAIRSEGPTEVRAPSERRRIVDLTLPITASLPGASVTTARTIAADGWNATTLSLYSHCGTHMDAPRHFLDGGATIDQQPLSRCCGPAKVLDLTPVQPRELFGVERLARWAERIVPGDRLLLRTDWHRRFGTEAYRHELPRISVELARWLVERQVALLGVEPPSVADVNNLEEITAVHQILLRGNVVIVEGLAHLDEIPVETVEFVALPLRVAGGDGSPVRAIASFEDASPRPRQESDLEKCSRRT
ncbi:MAG TPA: cyclase family protein [Planctomycetaceae bacterium]|nr:cyclase family protein [Planctomycetaceae bacterium]